ncbi:hypothetical protein [Arthrobacter sp. Z1-15]
MSSKVRVGFLHFGEWHDLKATFPFPDRNEWVFTDIRHQQAWSQINAIGPQRARVLEYQGDLVLIAHASDSPQAEDVACKYRARN